MEKLQDDPQTIKPRLVGFYYLRVIMTKATADHLSLISSLIHHITGGSGDITRCSGEFTGGSGDITDGSGELTHGPGVLKIR